MTVAKLIDELVKLPRGADVILHVSDATHVRVLGWPRGVVWIQEKNAAVIAGRTEGVMLPAVEVTIPSSD